MEIPMKRIALLIVVCFACFSLGAIPDVPAPIDPTTRSDKLDILKKRLADLDAKIATAKTADDKIEAMNARVTALSDKIDLVLTAVPVKPTVEPAPVIVAPPPAVVYMAPTYSAGMDDSAAPRVRRRPIRTFLRRIFRRKGSESGGGGMGSGAGGS